MINWRKPVIIGLLYLSGSKIPQYLKEISKVDQLSLKQKEQYHEKKLKKILLHAYNNIPYYNKVLTKCKVVVDGIVYLENFDKIPVLTKDIIRKEWKNLYSKDYKKRKPYENTSGGSTGEPVRFIQDKKYDEWNIANKIWIKLRVGQEIGNKELRFWGSERDLLDGKEKLSIRLRNWLYNRKEFNTFKMSEKEMNNYIIQWNKYKPFWVESYVQSIYEFAKFIKGKKIKIYSPKNGILTSAGTLYPQMKELIEEVFRCNVYNRYGSREVGLIACSCKKNNELDLNISQNHIEILNDKLEPVKPEKMGKIYVTGLNNYSMPMIRYDIGDIGEFSKKWSWLKKIEGRKMSICKTSSGKKIPAEFFIHFVGVVYNHGGIKKFQVIQKDYNLIEIKVILDKKKQFELDKENINKAIKLEMGNDCKIKWNFVKDIPPLKNGKYEYVRSEIR